MFPDLTPDDYREWINSRSNNEAGGTSKTYDGLDDSLAFLNDYLKNQPRFDVIAGHSNGALMTSILSLLVESDPDWLPKDKKWSAIVLFNAPASYETEVSLKELVGKHGPIQMPSIHVFGGETDLCWAGQQMMQEIHHPNGKIVQHEAGHFFPKEQQYYDDILSGLNGMV
jgi:hypothetical protein